MKPALSMMKPVPAACYRVLRRCGALRRAAAAGWPLRLGRRRRRSGEQVVAASAAAEELGQVLRRAAATRSGC